MTDEELDEFQQEIDTEIAQMDTEDRVVREKKEESWLGSIISTVIGSAIGAAL